MCLKYFSNKLQVQKFRMYFYIFIIFQYQLTVNNGSAIEFKFLKIRKFRVTSFQSPLNSQEPSSFFLLKMILKNIRVGAIH